MEPTVPDPVFLNLEYIFFLIYRALARFFSFVFSGDFYITLKTLATFLVIILITIILYCLVRLYELKQEDKKKDEASTLKKDEVTISENDTGKNQTWEAIREKILSDDPSGWRLAIIEADIYLDKVLDKKGVFGDTLGDKLKSLTEDRLPSLQLAWEAHKVRNRIAHEGADYFLSQPEARRTLSYFEIVFRDLEVIA